MGNSPPEQWEQMKASEPDSIVIITKDGDFYESFGADAREICDVFNLVVTTMYKGGESLDMCGFHGRMIEAVIEKLAVLGHRVIVFSPAGVSSKFQ